jgi:hypothetical protein
MTALVAGQNVFINGGSNADAGGADLTWSAT